LLCSDFALTIFYPLTIILSLCSDFAFTVL